MGWKRNVTQSFRVLFYRVLISGVAVPVQLALIELPHYSVIIKHFDVRTNSTAAYYIAHKLGGTVPFCLVNRHQTRTTLDAEALCKKTNLYTQ